MSVEFSAKIDLDARSATAQVKKFSSQMSEASRILKAFQAETKSTTQGTSNIFRGYINSTKKAAIQTENSIKKIHDLKLSYKDLSDEQKKLVNSVDKLNRQYDESARSEHKLLQIRREMRQVVAAGLKTQKEANLIYSREALLIKKSTKAYKEKQSSIKKNNDLISAQKQRLNELNIKYNKNADIQNKVRKATKELNLLKRKGLLTSKQHVVAIRKETKAIKAQINHIARLTSAQHSLAKAARLVSIISRVWLGVMAVSRLGTFIKDVEQTAEKIDLLKDKLEFLTGDSGAYRKLFLMTQDVGIELEAANKIITRFAVVTDKAFKIESLVDWTSTLVQSARATGTSSQEMTGALIQITQAMSAGRLMGDEFRSVTENLPLYTVALRELFSSSTLSLKEMSSQGLLTNDVLIKGFDRLKLIIADFPDSTQTVEAAIGRLSSAWDNFLNTVNDSDFTKSSLNFTTDLLNGASGLVRLTGALLDISEGLGDFNEIKELNSKIEETKQKLHDLQKNKDNNWTLEFFDKKNIQGFKDKLAELESELKVILDLNKEVAAQEAKAQIAKDKKSFRDDQVQAIKDELKLTKEKLILEQMLEKISGGKSIDRVKKQAELDRGRIKQSNLVFKDGGIGASDEQAKKANAEIEATEKQSILRIQRLRVAASLKQAELNTKFDIEDLKRELSHNGKILAINKKFADDKLEIESAAAALLLEIDEGIPEGKRTGLAAKEAKKLMEVLNIQKTKDIADSLYEIGDAIVNIGNSSANSILDFELDKASKGPKSDFQQPVSADQRALGQAKLDVGLVDSQKIYNDGYLEIQENMIKIMAIRDQDTTAMQEAAGLKLEMLGQEKEAREEALNTDFLEEFDNATIIQMENAQALVDVWDSVGNSIAKGVGDAYASAIVDQQDLGKALNGLMKSVAKNVISSLIQIGIQRAIQATLAITTEKTVLASSVTSAIATANAWSSAAAAVNAATFGAAAAAGTIQLINIAAASKTLFAIPQAHAGLDRTEEGTMVLKRNEMVLDSGTSEKIRKNVDNATTGGEFGGSSLVVNVNAIDAESFVNRVGKDDVTNEIWNKLLDKMNEEGRSFA